MPDEIHKKALLEAFHQLGELEKDVINHFGAIKGCSIAAYTIAEALKKSSLASSSIIDALEKDPLIIDSAMAVLVSNGYFVEKGGAILFSNEGGPQQHPTFFVTKKTEDLHYLLLPKESPRYNRK